MHKFTKLYKKSVQFFTIDKDNFKHLKLQKGLKLNEVQQLMLDKLAWRKFVTAASIPVDDDDDDDDK